MYGIPNMKLEKKVVQRRTDLMSAEGIRFVTETNVGQLPVNQLLTVLKPLCSVEVLHVLAT